jgi:cob(I)alamin adenosyltransferase
MGNRLSKITTRTGDDGTTGLGDGRRVSKLDPRIEAMGALDELNSTIGVVIAVAGIPPEVGACLLDVQHDLFDLGGELCIPGHRLIREEQILRLEARLGTFNAALPPLREFILPGGGPASAACHVARAVARRAERRIWALHGPEAPGEFVPRYLNRVSDLLFVLARVLARHERGGEVLWRRD